MIDTHAHYNSRDLRKLKEDIIRVNNNDKIERVINVGINPTTNEEVLDIANNNEKFYAALGIHPLSNGTIESIYNLSKTEDFSKVVALGETGLDFIIDINYQMKNFTETIELANYLGLPVIIHANKTNKECLDVIKEKMPVHGFVFHCFEPDLDILKEIMKLNGFISLGTPITKENAKKSIEVIKNVDINNLLIETDYPYMIIDSENDLQNVFNRITEVRNYKPEDLEFILNNNAKRLFRKLN